MTRLDGWKQLCAAFLVFAASAIAAPAQATFISLASFDGNDGMYPASALVQGLDGNFYGTTENGGPYTTCQSGCGTVFRITREGKLTRLYSFCSLADCADGDYPISPLTLATNGKLFGTT